MPLRDFECLDCGLKHVDHLVGTGQVPRCEGCRSTHVQLVLSFPATYQIKGDNSGSTRPRKGSK